MDIILSGVECQSALDYLENIITYFKLVTEHLIHGRAVPTLLQNAVLALRLSKSSFVNDTVSYPRHTGRLGKLAVDKKNCKGVRKSLRPTIQTELRVYL